MIKINLLPAHILERRRLRSVIIIAAAVVILEVAVLGVAMTRVKGQLTDANTELAYWKQQAGKVAQFDSVIQSTNGQAGFYGRWVAWDTMIGRYHEAWAENLQEFARWIYARVQVDSLLPTPQQVQIQGRTDTLSSFRKAYLNIIRCPRYANVAFNITGITSGYVQGQTGAGPALRGPRPVAGSFGGLGGSARTGGGFGGGGGLQLRLGSRAGMGRPTAAPAQSPFGMPRQAPRAMAFRGQRAPAGAGPQQLAALDRLRVGVTFSCLLKPQYTFQLIPPQPPVGGVPVTAAAGRGGGAAARARGGGLQIRMGGRSNTPRGGGP